VLAERTAVIIAHRLSTVRIADASSCSITARSSKTDACRIVASGGE
jgi:hypothetical protein